MNVVVGREEQNRFRPLCLLTLARHSTHRRKRAPSRGQLPRIPLGSEPMSRREEGPAHYFAELSAFAGRGSLSMHRALEVCARRIDSERNEFRHGTIKRQRRNWGRRLNVERQSATNVGRAHVEERRPPPLLLKIRAGFARSACFGDRRNGLSSGPIFCFVAARGLACRLPVVSPICKSQHAGRVWLRFSIMR